MPPLWDSWVLLQLMATSINQMVSHWQEPPGYQVQEGATAERMYNITDARGWPYSENLRVAML